MSTTKYFAVIGDEAEALDSFVNEEPYWLVRDTVAEAGNDAHFFAKDRKVTVFKITAVGVYGPEV